MIPSKEISGCKAASVLENTNGFKILSILPAMTVMTISPMPSPLFPITKAIIANKPATGAAPMTGINDKKKVTEKIKKNS